jgi:phosphinothricin acetyltransferase
MSLAAARERLSLRDATDADLAAIAAIYAHHVRTGRASFELEPPNEAEMGRRRADVLARGLPYLVAELDGTVVGFAYAGPYRPRPAYRYTLEDSVYVAPDAGRRGAGHALLAALIERCTALGYRAMVAVIGDSANAASIRLHEKAGFGHAGTLRSVGWKLGQWTDSILMIRPLGPGDTTSPGPLG